MTIKYKFHNGQFPFYNKAVTLNGDSLMDILQQISSGKIYDMPGENETYMDRLKKNLGLL